MKNIIGSAGSAVVLPLLRRRWKGAPVLDIGLDSVWNWVESKREDIIKIPCLRGWKVKIASQEDVLPPLAATPTGEGVKRKGSANIHHTNKASLVGICGWILIAQSIDR